VYGFGLALLAALYLVVLLVYPTCIMGARRIGNDGLAVLSAFIGFGHDAV